MNIIDYEFLLPGHVFTREDGSSSRLLFITNTSLSQKGQKRFPPQVVYADENDNILSRDIPSFLATREFFNVDPELEARLKALLVQTGEHPEDELDLDNDLDGLVISDPDELDTVLSSLTGGSEEPDEEEPSDEPSVIGAAIADLADVEADMKEDAAAEPSVTYVAVNVGLPAALTADQLAAATASYQQGVNPTNGNIQHTLFIRADEGITKELLDKSFNPLLQDESTMYAPRIRLNGELFTFDWDILRGIYPAVFFDDHMYQVILESQAQEPLEIDPTDPRDELAVIEAGEPAPVGIAAEVVGLAAPAVATPTAPAAQPAQVVNAAPAATVVVNAAPAAVQVSA